MPALKFLHYTDIHLRETNPPSRLGDFREDVLGKLRQIVGIARKYKVDFTVCGGDLFDSKKPMATKHSTVTSVAEIFNSLNIPHLIVPGNHDLTGDAMNSLPEQPLGVLLETRVFRQIRNEVFHSKKTAKPSKGDLSIRIQSFPFEEEPVLSEMVVQENEDTKVDFNILGIHVYASPKGGTLFGKTKVFSYGELAITNHDMYLLGHYHADNGVIRTVLKKEQTFVNIGSVTRGDYGDENLSRIPKVCVVTIDKDDEGVITVTTEEIPLVVRPNEETFDLEKKEKLKENKEKATEFVTKLQVATQSVETDMKVEEQVSILTTEKEVLETTMYYMNAAAEELNKVVHK